MSYSHLALAALGATVAYFAYGFLVFWLVPSLVNESRKYPAVFRSHEEINKVMPMGMVAMLVCILVAAVLFAMIHPGGAGAAGPGAVAGARFGALIGLFVVCGFVIHNYVNLNIGVKLAVQQAIAYFVQWIIVGVAIGLIYRPVATP